MFSYDILDYLGVFDCCYDFLVIVDNVCVVDEVFDVFVGIKVDVGWIEFVKGGFEFVLFGVDYFLDKIGLEDMFGYFC